MFANRRFKLRGEAFLTAVKALTDPAYSNYSVLKRHLEGMYPRRWKDQLSSEQNCRFFFVSMYQDWLGCAAHFRSHLADLPVLSLALVHCPDSKQLKYVLIGTHEGFAACFCLEGLADEHATLKKAELLPAEVRDWLSSSEVAILTSGLAPYFEERTEGFVVRNQTDTEHVYQAMQASGSISTPIKGEGDTMWQLAFAVEYHHRPVAQRTFRALLGRDGYVEWPQHRSPPFRPTSVFDCVNSFERFYFYYEALAPHIFIDRLLIQGIVYGGVPNLEAEAPLKDLYRAVLSSAGSRPHAAGKTPTAAPPALSGREEPQKPKEPVPGPSGLATKAAAASSDARAPSVELVEERKAAAARQPPRATKAKKTKRLKTKNYRPSQYREPSPLRVVEEVEEP